MKSFILPFFLLLSFNMWAYNADPCSCEEAAQKVLQAEGMQEKLVAYADWQMFHIDFYINISYQFLKEGNLYPQGKRA